MDKNKFINGFKSWQETHFEMAGFISNQLMCEGNCGCKVIIERQEQQGHCGLYELAIEWTDEFQKLHKNRKWDGEYFDEIDKFLKSKIQ